MVPYGTYLTVPCVLEVRYLGTLLSEQSESAEVCLPRPTPAYCSLLTAHCSLLTMSPRPIPSARTSESHAAESESEFVGEDNTSRRRLSGRRHWPWMAWMESRRSPGYK